MNEKPGLPQGVLSYGAPEQALIDMARANFTGSSFAALSFGTTPVEVLPPYAEQGDDPIAHATGFFWRGHGSTPDMVITNWHVLSGRNAFTGEVLRGIIPRRLRVDGWTLSMGPEGSTSLARKGWILQLSDEAVDAFSTPPTINGYPYDVAALPLPDGFMVERGPGLEEHPLAKLQPAVNVHPFDHIPSQAGDEVALLAYPLRNYTGLKLPIWKRGSLSSDTQMTIDGSPAFLIDAATSEAMSGSPIFRRATTGATKTSTGEIVEHAGFEFIGVYGGRLQNKELERINVGYGWLGTLVPHAVGHCWPLWLATAR